MFQHVKSCVSFLFTPILSGVGNASKTKSTICGDSHEFSTNLRQQINKTYLLIPFKSSETTIFFLKGQIVTKKPDQALQNLYFLSQKAMNEKKFQTKKRLTSANVQSFPMTRA